MPHKDPEKAREYNRNWQRANREKTREYWRKWYEANPEYMREYRATHPQYRARQSLAAQEYWAANRERKNELGRASKARCKARREAEMSEIIAEIQGATNV